jgi:glycosyltransferase involved in cell wall biosynthesis
MPRSLLEAAAMAKPLITTDTPGCRNVVDDGVNGWLCKVRDARDLADKMLRFAELSDERRHEMGRQSRLKAEREFDERLVIEAYLEAVKEVLPKREPVFCHPER